MQSDNSGCGELYCRKCGVKLESLKTEFKYMASSFQHDVPRCPICGQVHVPPETASGRLLELELQLEEK